MKSQLTLLILLSLFCAKKEINPEQEILETILNSKKEIEAYKVENQVLCESSKCLFVAFWDFDGTILKGDCSEGLEENGKQVYEGLIELGRYAEGVQEKVLGNYVSGFNIQNA